MPQRLTYRCLPVDRLSATEWDRWHQLQQADARFGSPYFHPEFTRCVSAVRGDVEVLVVDQSGTPRGFLPFQRIGNRQAIPVGGLLNDFHGMITDLQHVAVRELLASAGLNSWSFHHALTSQRIWQAGHYRSDDSPFMDLSSGFARYLASCQHRHRRTFKDLRRRRRDLEKQHGPIHVQFHVTSAEVLDQLFSWKQEQYRRTQVADVFAVSWTTQLLRTIAKRQEWTFRGVLSAMYAGDRLAAAHFGMQAGRTFHCWFPAFAPDLGRWSPGLQLFVEIARLAADQGVTRMDLGKGPEGFKQKLRSDGVAVAEGIVEQSAARQHVRYGWYRATQLVKSSPLRVPLKRVARWITPDRGLRAFR